MAKTDILVPVFNGISDAAEMYDSLKRTTADYRLIIIDNASTDGTREFFESQKNVEVIALEKNQGFAGAINEGIKRIEAENVVFLNSDVILTKGWLDRLIAYKEKVPAPVGMIGPVSNFAGGRQMIPTTERTAELQAQKLMKDFQGKPSLEEVSFLSFFCCLLDSELIASIGPLNDWFPGGFEDNAYGVRAWEAGWKLLVARDVFVQHKGSRTLIREFGDKNVVFNQQFKYYREFFEKINNPKVVALYRVKNDQASFKKSLEQTSKIVDAIYVWDDNSKPSLRNLVGKFPKVEKYYESHLPFDEYRDRSMLLSWAKASSYEWALVLDSDEMLEPKVTYLSLHELIKIPDPIIRSFVFHETTFWFDKFFRMDGIWKGQAHDRLFKLNMNQELRQGTEKGFHCSTTPVFPPDSRRITSLRIEHYGYLKPKRRIEKYKFYTEQDTNKKPELIGGENYSHLKDNGTLQVCKYIPNNHFALNILMRKGEERETAQILNRLWGMPQQINVLAEEEGQVTQDLRELFRANVYLDTDGLDLPSKRNFLADKTTERWALFLDTDEEMDQPFYLRIMMDADPDAYLFYVQNLQKDKRSSVSENVRMFKTGKGLRFEGKVHETIEKSLKALPEAKVVNSPIKLIHYGYLKGDAFLAEKLEHYYETLLEELKERPQDERIHFSLALHYFNNDDAQKGLEHLQTAIRINPNFFEAKKEMVQWHVFNAVSLLQSFTPRLPDSYPLKKRLTEMLDTLQKVNEPRIKIAVGTHSAPDEQGKIV